MKIENVKNDLIFNFYQIITTIVDIRRKILDIRNSRKTQRFRISFSIQGGRVLMFFIFLVL